MEVTLHGTKNDRRAAGRLSCPDAATTSVNDARAAELTNDGGLVDVAGNTCCSPVESVYFPPNPPGRPIRLANLAGRSKRRARVFADVEVLLKIARELDPLRYQYSEIIGKIRALGLSDASLLDLDKRLDRADRRARFGRSALSLNAPGYFLDRKNESVFRRAAASSRGLDDEYGRLVGKTPPPTPTFSMVGKPDAIGTTRAGRPNEDGVQEALNPARRDSSRALERFDSLRASGRLGNSASYLPATDSRASYGKDVPGGFGELHRSRDERVFDSRHYREPSATIGRDTRVRTDRAAYGAIQTHPSDVLRKTERDMRYQYLGQMENSRISSDNVFDVEGRKCSASSSSLDRSQRLDATPRTACRSDRHTSKFTIVEVMHDKWRTVAEETMSERSHHGCIGVLSSDPNPPIIGMKLASGSTLAGHRPSWSSTEIIGDDRLPPARELESIDQETRATTRASQIRVVSVNAEFHATVEKRYISRAVSPIRDRRARDATIASPSPSNVLLARMSSSVFVQRVRADSARTEVSRVTSAREIRSADVNERRDAADEVNERDDADARNVDSRPAAEGPSKLPGSMEERREEETGGDEDKNENTCRTMRESRRRTRCLGLPRATGEEIITIVPAILADGVSESSPRIVGGDHLAIPWSCESGDVTPPPPQSVCRIEPPSFRARKSHGIRAVDSALRADNETFERAVAVPRALACLTEEVSADGKRRRADSGGTSASRVPLCTDRRDCSPLTTTRNTKRPIRVAAASANCAGGAETSRECGAMRAEPRAGVARRAIPGMRSSPEDFLCDT